MRKILAAACSPERAEWYFNNTRYRSRLSKADDEFFGKGTCRNEQVHATLNAQYREVVQISSRMLKASLQAWLAAEMAVFLRAMTTSTTVGIKRVNLRPMVISGIELFSHQEWGSHLRTPSAAYESKEKMKSHPMKSARGPQKDQEDVFKSIREKTQKRKRATVYEALTQKRLRSK